VKQRGTRYVREAHDVRGFAVELKGIEPMTF
jgi:hypothetical protein